MSTPPTNRSWLATTEETALEPDLPICDPHHHLWDQRTTTVAQRYLLDELLEDLSGGHNVRSTVFVEATAMYRADGPDALRPIGETEFVNGIAAMSASGLYGPVRAAAAIVGFADLRLGAAVADVLDRQIAAGNGRFHGIRHSAAWDADSTVPRSSNGPGPGLFLRDDFRTGFKELAPRQLTFEVWCYHPQISEATALARAFPDTTIILDHFGGPLGVGSYAGRADAVFSEWQQMIRELAACSNVVAKLGGLNMALNGYGWDQQAQAPTSAELLAATRRYYEFAIEQFGVDRCMFESNFPVDKLSCSYVVLWNSFKLLTAGYSASEKAKLFHDNAVRIYRIGS